MRFLLLILTFFFAASEAWSQSAPVTPESEYQKRIKVSEDIQPLGENPFGESISLYNGALSFEQTDVSSAGIGPLLQLGRSFRPPDTSPNTVYHTFFNNAFVDWSLELPRIETLSATSGTGNVPPLPTASWFFISDVHRCSWLAGAPDEYITIPKNVITYTADKW